jgi:Hypothetical protein (DUF2513)
VPLWDLQTSDSRLYVREGQAMRCDWNLIRKILLALEDASPAPEPIAIAIDGYSARAVEYHARIVVEAKLALAVELDLAPLGTPVMLERLTAQGHAFVELARSPRRWQQTLKKVNEQGGAVTFEVLRDLLDQLMRKELLSPDQPS